MRPLAIDLFCGLGGWTKGLLAEGWDVIGFDVERHAYGLDRNPAQLVLQDVLTIHGSCGPRENGKGDAWFQNGAARHGSKFSARKAASARIAMIPERLSRHIAQFYFSGRVA